MLFSLPAPAEVAEIRARDLKLRCGVGAGLCLFAWGVTGQSYIIALCICMLVIFAAKPPALRWLERHARCQHTRNAGLLIAALICNSLLAVPAGILWAHGTPEAAAGAALIWCVMLLGALFDRDTLGNIRIATALPHAASLVLAPTISMVQSGGTMLSLQLPIVAGGICVWLVALVWHRHERNVCAMRTALARAEREEAISRLLFDQSALSAALLDTDGRIVAVSDRFRRYHGLSKMAMIGKRYVDFYPHVPAHWHEAIQRAMYGETVRYERDEVRINAGHVFYSSWEVHPWKSGADVKGVIIYAENVTALIEAEKRKQSAETRLCVALDGTRAAVWEIDFATRTLEADERLKTLFGQVPSYKLVVSCEPIHPNDRDHVRAVIEQARARPGRYTAEHRILQPDGSVIWCTSTAQSLAMPKGHPGRIVVMSIDISERKQIELDFAHAMARAEVKLQGKRTLIETLARETGQLLPPPQRIVAHIEEGVSAFGALHQRLARLLAEIELRDRALFDSVEALSQARELAQTASAAKTEFLANVSHELRTPLNAVIGYAEILGEDLADTGLAQSVEDSQRIVRAARQLLGLINGILDLSKIEAGRMELSLSCVDVKKLLQESVDILEPAATSRGNSIHLVISPEVTTIESDALKLRQCVLNLLSNANKFTQSGNITVHARRADKDRRSVLMIDVTDTGCGMTPEQVSKLFQAFVQVDTDGQRRSHGTGLGLVITQRLAQLLGGDVNVTSAVHVGTTFSLAVSERAMQPQAARVA